MLSRQSIIIIIYSVPAIDLVPLWAMKYEDPEGTSIFKVFIALLPMDHTHKARPTYI